MQTQVAEIWVEATESRGTGYLLCSGCLLTAHHVIKDCPDTGVSFRLLGDFQADPDRWLHSSRIWFNETLDIALVFFSENEQRLIGQGITIPPIARLEPSQTIVCQACGFPAFAQTEGRYRDYSLKGQLTPFGSVKEPALAKFKIEDEIPN
ncbi:hypothetical protein, partial [Prochlorothrix hollandica]|uniref:hypothetical protein n=1 Tax=Prochlorothrix hollandica TaxID=1223 RepID=UPI003341A68C